MKLQANKRYVRRDGSVTDPLTYDDGGSRYPFSCGKYCYAKDGRYHLDSPGHQIDLIAEYVETRFFYESLAGKIQVTDAGSMDILLKLMGDKDARIVELEAFCNDREASRIKAQLEWREMKAERDQLRKQLAAVTAETDDWRETARLLLEDNQRMHSELKTVHDTRVRQGALILDLQQELEATNAELATYKQPKLVKTLWTPIFSCGVDMFYRWSDSRNEALGAESDDLIGLVRADTYQNPDGTTYTVLELEPIGGEKK